MQSITRRMALWILTGAVITGAPISDTFADEPATPQTAADLTPAEPARPPAPEGSSPPPEAGEVQERGLFQNRLEQGIFINPQATTPAPTTRIPNPGITAPKPGTVLPPIQYQAPTPSLTAIRNALRVTAKSISVNLRIPPNLPVTVPVEVSVAYLSPVQTQRLTKIYSPVSGLTLLYREAEGDGTPRAMTLDITVRELVPNGKSFAISKQFKITPLYRATISPLRFNMATKCDTVGKSDITFRWIYFNGTRGEQKFDLGFGETKMVNHFNSGRREFSTEANLKEPVMQFFERDPGVEYHPPIGSSVIPLAPGSTKEFSFFLDEDATGPPPTQHSSSTKCKAHISYRIDRSVMRFDQF